ncbi:hypothetical protein [Kitasatospora sp. NPDC096140]|uniref:hypothetical protein n=1 Tax=Kitasatospora sp. NPDC096140 TaxID=3155425 RepID=UPI003325A47F
MGHVPDPPLPVVLGAGDLRPLPRAVRGARTGHEGLRLPEEHRDGFIDTLRPDHDHDLDLDLDHDLDLDGTVMPVVTLMGAAALTGQPCRTGAVVRSPAPPGGCRVRQATPLAGAAACACACAGGTRWGRVAGPERAHPRPGAGRGCEVRAGSAREERGAAQARTASAAS